MLLQIIQYGVYGVQEPAHHEKHLAGSLIKKEGRISDIGCLDPRVPGFGYRVVSRHTEGIGSIHCNRTS
jgi:hypothetical protein